MNIEKKINAFRLHPYTTDKMSIRHQEILSKYNTLGEMKMAAVMVLILKKDDSYELLLTKRAQHLKNHAGEICFPGGSSEPDDNSHQETALRETKEEVGINSSEIEIIGMIPAIPTFTGFIIHPIIGLVNEATNIVIAPSEVESYFTVPFLYFLNYENKQEYVRRFNNTDIPIIEYHYNGARIWGATAMIISLLCEKLMREDNDAC